MLGRSKLSEIVPAALAFSALLSLAFSHWLQMPDQAMTAMVGVLAGAGTLYYVNKTHRHAPDGKVIEEHEDLPPKPQ